MSDTLAQLMSEVDDLRNKVSDIHTCLIQIQSDLNTQREYPSDHHKFVEEWIQKQKRRREVWDKISAQVGGWTIIIILGAIGTYVYNHTIGFIK